MDHRNFAGYGHAQHDLSETESDAYPVSVKPALAAELGLAAHVDNFRIQVFEFFAGTNEYFAKNDQSNKHTDEHGSHDGGSVVRGGVPRVARALPRTIVLIIATVNVLRLAAH